MLPSGGPAGAHCHWPQPHHSRCERAHPEGNNVFEAATKSNGSSLPLLLLIVVLGVVYFVFMRNMRRKQQAQAADQQSMRTNLSPGTEIVTIGGLYGTVVDMDDDSVMLEISDGVTARYDRNAIAKVLSTPETDETDDDGDQDDLDHELHSTDLDATANSIVEQKD
jgi:preprotein translocase subunit YajC